MSSRWDKEFYDRAYRTNYNGQIYHYGRVFAQRIMKRENDELSFYIDRWNFIKSIPAISYTKSKHILFIGCGFGYLMEVAIDAGYNNVVGIDTSPWIFQELSKEARADVAAKIYDIDVCAADALAKFRDLVGKLKFHVVITEDVVTDFFVDDELATLLASCEEMLSATSELSNIVHLVTTLSENQDSGYRWQTLEQWKNINPNHTWVDIPNKRYAS